MTQEQGIATRTGEKTSALGVPALEEMPDVMRPLAEIATRIQSDFMTLWSRRAEAYLDLPQQVAACRSIGDLIEEQTKFLTIMQRHYADYVGLVTRAMQTAQEEAEQVTARVRNGKAGGMHDHHQRAA